MNAAGDQHDRLAPGDQFRRFAITSCRRTEFAWIGQQFLSLLVFSQARKIFWRADCRHYEWLAHRRFAQLLKPDSVTGFSQRFEVSNHLVPAREFSIVAGHKPENLFRDGNVRDKWRWSSNRMRAGTGK